MNRRTGFSRIGNNFYSRTYPRYENYSAMENQKDMIDLIETIYENKKVEMKDYIFYNKDGSIGTEFSQNVISVVGDQISSSPIIIREISNITMNVISSSEASSILSSPVYNLIINSKEICSYTVNTIGNALSDNVLSNQMKDSVNTIVTNSEQICSYTINTIGNALSNDLLSTEMNKAMSTVFMSTDISGAMIKPVSEVIPTNEVSSEIVGVVSSGFDISSIYGGSDYKDDNHDGIPDDEDGTFSMVFGNLGA